MSGSSIPGLKLIAVKLFELSRGNEVSSDRRTDGQTDGRTDGQTDGQTDRQTAP